MIALRYDMPLPPSAARGIIFRRQTDCLFLALRMKGLRRRWLFVRECWCSLVGVPRSNCELPCCTARARSPRLGSSLLALNIPSLRSPLLGFARSEIVSCWDWADNWQVCRTGRREKARLTLVFLGHFTIFMFGPRFGPNCASNRGCPCSIWEFLLNCVFDCPLPDIHNALLFNKALNPRSDRV